MSGMANPVLSVPRQVGYGLGHAVRHGEAQSRPEEPSLHGKRSCNYVRCGNNV